jgi:hypothetical protein
MPANLKRVVLSFRHDSDKGDSMPIEPQNPFPSDSPIHLSSAIRQAAAEYSEKEGISLDQFVTTAVLLRLDYLKQQEWVRNRQKPTPELVARALELLEKDRGRKVDPGDELPPGYRST